MSLLFQKLKRKQSIVRRDKAVDLFFHLHFDDEGRAHLLVKNQAGQEVPDFDYQAYSGGQRGILKTIDAIRDNNAFRIDWNQDSDAVYLAEHDYLIPALLACGRFKTADGKAIHATEGLAQPRITIEGDTMLNCRLYLEHDGHAIANPTFLSESHALAGHHIFETKPMGENVELLNLFQTQIPKADLQRYLCLLYSSYERIQVDYKGYKAVPGEVKPALPGLVFEKIDHDKSLYLRICQVAGGLSPAFFKDYDVDCIVDLNDMEKKLIIHPVDSVDLYQTVAEIKRRLNKHRKKVDDDYFHQDDLFIIDPELTAIFIENELATLLSKYVIFGSENLKSYKVRTKPPRLNLKVGYGIDFLEGKAELIYEDETLTLADALAQFRKSGYLKLSDGSRGIVDKSWVEKLERLFRKAGKGVKVSFFDLPEIAALLEEVPDDESFTRARDVYEGFNHIADSNAELPPIKATLRPYQEQGFKWLNYLYKNNLGGCLADDMGLGKTLQAITILQATLKDTDLPSLVVMPRSLLFNWLAELTKFAPDIKAVIYHGPQRDPAVLDQHDVILTTYGVVRNDIERFKDRVFHFVILDESQNIKNLQSQATKAVFLLQAQHRLALSGTPVENNLGELYSLFRFLNPAMFGSAQDFSNHYAQPIQKDGDPEVVEALRRKIYPFILRRLKRDVLKELPPKVEQTLYVDMSAEQASYYEKRRSFYQKTVREQVASEGVKGAQFYILQAMSELRQIASIPEVKTDDEIRSPKRGAVVEQITDVVTSGHKVLVFANFLGVLERLAGDLNTAGIKSLTMTGATRDRQALVDRFQTDPSVHVFLMTLKTGGVGLNLTAADYVFIFDPWWNRSAENQAVDRSHRMGQQNTVFTYRLITKETIEEKIALLQEQKTELVDSLITADAAGGLKSLSNEDIDYLFG